MKLLPLLGICVFVVVVTNGENLILRELYRKSMYACTNPYPNNCTSEFHFSEAIREPKWRCPHLDAGCGYGWRVICEPINGKCYCRRFQPRRRFDCMEGCRLTRESFPYCLCPNLPDCVDPGFLGLGFFRTNCGYTEEGQCFCEGWCKHAPHNRYEIDSQIPAP